MNEFIALLEEHFSLHDADQIYNLLAEFSTIDTNCGEITFNDWLRERRDK